MNELTPGTRIYYGGDMANMPETGTILEIRRTRWGNDYQIKYDTGRTTFLPICLFSPIYLGHGGTRFVTLEAYNQYRRNQLTRAGYSPELAAKHDIKSLED